MCFSFYELEFPLPTYTEICCSHLVKAKFKQVTCGGKPHVRHFVTENIKHASMFTCYKLKSKDHHLLITKKVKSLSNKL